MRAIPIITHHPIIPSPFTIHHSPIENWPFSTSSSISGPKSHYRGLWLRSIGSCITSRMLRIFCACLSLVRPFPNHQVPCLVCLEPTIHHHIISHEKHETKPPTNLTTRSCCIALHIPPSPSPSPPQIHHPFSSHLLSPSLPSSIFSSPILCPVLIFPC